MAKKAAKKRRYSRSSGSDVKSEMRRYKKGTAKSRRGGKGGKVKSRKQAIAIGLSKARKKGKKVPEKTDDETQILSISIEEGASNPLELAALRSLQRTQTMSLAAYEIIGNDAEWRVRHDGKAENIYETKEAAFEAAVAKAPKRDRGMATAAK